MLKRALWMVLAVAVIVVLFDAIAEWSGGQARETTAVVGHLKIDDVIARIEMGERVLFVDAREAREYREQHLPGAINLTLRDMDTDAAQAMQGADLIITYCVKDFRGYELARALAQHMPGKVATLNPYGLKGWKARGLPVVQGDAPGTLAKDLQRACASGSTGRCSGGKG